MRIILADHHTEPLVALRLLLNEHPEFDVIGEAVDAQSLLLLASKNPAHLVLVDRELPGICINDQITSLHKLEPRPIVIVMSSIPEYRRPLLDAGADDFVSKVDQPDWLLAKLYKYTIQCSDK